MVRVQVLRGDEVVHVVTLASAPLRIGRAAGNDLVLSDSRVSSRHLSVFARDGAVWLEDLGSKNGTTLDGAEVTGRVEVPDGALVELGGRVRLRVVGRPDEAAALPALLVEDVASGVRHPVRGDRFAFGGSDADIELGDDRLATLVVHEAEVRLGTDDDDVELEVGQPFVVGGRRFVLVPAESEQSTERVQSASYPYRLEVAFDPTLGARASLEDLRTGTRHEVSSENRATLLFVLAQRMVEDLGEGGGDDAGWVADEDVATGIWGRQRIEQVPNNYNVLVYRLRRELKDAGFDPWFIEKRRGYIRARLRHVAVAS